MIDSVIAWSITAPSSGVMAACSSAVIPIAAAPDADESPTASAAIVKPVVMPESACPEMSQYSS